MKVRDIIKLLEADGWKLIRTRGSHRQYKHPFKAGLVTIAGKANDDLAPGTVNSIKKSRRSQVKYLIVIEETGTGYSTFSPDLPGCVATGQTVEEVTRQMKEAIIFHLEGMRKEGLPLPPPKSQSAMVEVSL